MASFLPAPPTIVVFSLSIMIFLARPRSVSLTESSWMPRSLKMACAAGQRGDVAQHRLAAIAVAGRLHRTDIQNAAELVDDQRRQRFAFDVLGDDQQRLVGLADRFQQRHQILGVRDFLFVDQDVAVFQLDDLLVLIGDEVRRQDSRGRTACPRRLRPSSRFACLLRP